MTRILQAFFGLLSKWTLAIAITAGTGKGTTNPPPGSYQIDHGVTVTVTAIPETGSFLDHWTIDGVNVGKDNPITVSE